MLKEMSLQNTGSKKRQTTNPIISFSRPKRLLFIRLLFSKLTKDFTD